MSPHRQEFKVGWKGICQQWVNTSLSSGWVYCSPSPSTKCHHWCQSFRAAATALELNSVNREVST